LIGHLVRPIKALVLSPFVSQDMGMMLAELNQKDLTILGDLMQAGKVTPVIDRTYKLSQVPEAIRYLEEGHARGKVVITLEPNNETSPVTANRAAGSVNTIGPAVIALASSPSLLACQLCQLSSHSLSIVASSGAIQGRGRTVGLLF
jgi:hypothetical protein